MASRSNSISLPFATWYELWRESRQQARPVDPEDASDRIADSPSQFATGYKRDIDLRNGINLTLHQYKFHDDLILTRMPPQDTNCIEFVFNLSSTFAYEQGRYIQPRQHYLLGRYNSGGEEEFIQFSQEPRLEVDIHLDPEQFGSLMGMGKDFRGSNCFEGLPTDLQRIITEDSEVFASPAQTITPMMQVALQQILNCPYQGVVKQMYLESKSLEVLALWLDQAIAAGNKEHSIATPFSTRQGSSDEIDRIYQAKNILTEQADNPPSLTALARQVGLNDCTLKRQFRQVFGTTVFGYLHHYRLEQARLLLLKQELSISAIAHQVGYKDVSAFGRAFRKKFGVCPRSLHTRQFFS
jgi:AraC family transcriptional regulator, transcriptional activator of the genes for pyochelin and ferripyochelin receptors